MFSTLHPYTFYADYMLFTDNYFISYIKYELVSAISKSIWVLIRYLHKFF